MSELPTRAQRWGQARDRFFNREWSWLRFNERVLEEAEDEENPLLERVKFASIFATNLDEFFMVRVAGLYRQVEARIPRSGTDQRAPREQIDTIAEMTHELVARHELAIERLRGQLSEAGVRIAGVEHLDAGQRAFVQRYYQEVIYPVITPTVVGPKHPFPALQSCTLCLIVHLRENRGRTLKHPAGGGRKRRPLIGLVTLPRVLPRFVRIDGAEGELTLVPLESILVDQMAALFAGHSVLSVNAVRLTRDADIALDEEATEDMRRAMAKKLLGRRHGAVVRIEHGASLDRETKQLLRAEFDLEAHQLYACRDLMQPGDLMRIYGSVDRPDLKDVPLEPLVVQRTRPRSIFDWIRQQPLLVYHPYHDFAPVAELVAEAAEDPRVLAIKQTLYRTSGDSPVVRALTRAAERGKQVTVVVELRARFDEEQNIEWARRLEHAGAHVVYGLVGLKTHCKALLVVRREPEGIRRYVHLGTGNYNDATARLFTDLGLITHEELYGEDVSALFNVITGGTEPPVWRKVEMSPTGMRRRLLHLIAREIDKSAPRSRGRIIAKMNSLVDGEIIDALYEASQAGVQVDLIIRGICCLRPGVKGLSDNIRVRSIVGRFLEHPRLLWLRNGGQEEIYLSSADWMPRNLDHRIELMFPVEQPKHVEYIKGVLDLQLRDSVKARQLDATGRYVRAGSTVGDRNDSQLAIYHYTRRLIAGAERNNQRQFMPLARGSFAG